MRAGQKYFWPALFALERGRRGINVDYCCLAHVGYPSVYLICLFHSKERLHALKIHKVGLVYHYAFGTAECSVSLMCVVCDYVSYLIGASVAKRNNST